MWNKCYINEILQISTGDSQKCANEPNKQDNKISFRVDHMICLMKFSKEVLEIPNSVPSEPHKEDNKIVFSCV